MELGKANDGGINKGMWTEEINNELKINAGSATFLVNYKVNSGKSNSEVIDWLSANGFSRWKYSKGYYEGVDWLFINVNSKVYANGMPGIKITSPIDERMILWNDFLIIYEILERSKKMCGE